MSTKKQTPPAVDETPNPVVDDSNALRAQIDRLLDAVVEQQEQIDALKTAQIGASAVAVQQNDTAAQFDAELAALKEEFKDYPLIEVVERRALVGMDANLDIRLKGDPSVVEDRSGETCRWKLRWFNYSKEGRAQQAQAEGYMKVRWDELADQESIGGTGQRVDDYVRKGDRGYEVLHKIPRKLYAYKKRRDAAREAGLLTSQRGMKDHLADKVAAMVGAAGGNADQAGSFLHGKGFTLDITKGETERFTA